MCSSPITHHKGVSDDANMNSNGAPGPTSFRQESRFGSDTESESRMILTGALRDLCCHSTLGYGHGVSHERWVGPECGGGVA